MTQVRIVINDEVLLDAALDTWIQTAPELFKDALDPNAKPQPWLKAIMIVAAEATMTNTGVSIEATTGPDGWDLKVRHP
jgi:hypothetical protein